MVFVPVWIRSFHLECTACWCERNISHFYRCLFCVCVRVCVSQLRNKFMKKLPRDAEASNVLVGEVDFLDAPFVAFVRLQQAVMLGALTEVPVPTRWPTSGAAQGVEVPGSLCRDVWKFDILFCFRLQVFIHPAWTQRQSQVVPWDRQSHRHAHVWRGGDSTDMQHLYFIILLTVKKTTKKLLWSSVCSELPVWGVLGGITVQVFHDIAYKAKDRQDLLAGIDEFLDEVIVLPPGEWDPAIRIEPPKNLPPPDKRSKPTRWTVSNKEGRCFDDMLKTHCYFLPQHPPSGKTCMLALTLRWTETCPTMEVTEEEDTQSAKSWQRLAGTEPWM